MIRRVLVVAALLLATLAACSDGGSSPDGSASSRKVGRAETPKDVAIQVADLPTGFEECKYSGDIETYLANVSNVDPKTHDSLMRTWGKFKEAGATAAYAAFYGDSDRACDNFILPAEKRNFGTEEEHISEHPKIVTSMVFQFPDDVTAEAAYKADLFGQSNLKEEIAMDVKVGEPSRLGPNSISAATQGAPVQIRQVAWQRTAWNVLFRSAALDRQASEAVTAAMNIRMG